MAGKRASARDKAKGKASRSAVPDVYRDMLAEALPEQADLPERLQKRRKTGSRNAPAVASSSKPDVPKDTNDDDDEEIQFEDVLDTERASSPPRPQQTIHRDSDEESESSDEEDLANINFDFQPDDSPESSGNLELTLTKPSTPQTKGKSPAKRRAVTKDERIIRVQVHKMHVLCLLSYLDRRNGWCNDVEVHKSLKSLLDKKTIKLLRPSSDLSQFSQTNSLKRGIEAVSLVWKTRFKITERGMRRALWAEDEKDLHNYRLPEDSDPTLDKSDFREAAKSLQGSRDVGAQLYCALLRSVGVETRLVCSLQPLPFTAGGPSMPRPSAPKASAKPPPQPTIQSSPSSSNPRSRLGHPNAAAYHLPTISTPSRPQTTKPKPIIESQRPIFWTEVFDTAHQKWFPVDALVTDSIAKPGAFEPPASDHLNNMTYVIAFEEEGCAKDVTKRYTKAYNAKVRKARVENTPKGERWWRKAMKRYRRGYTSDIDQIEDTELAAAEAREPMPKNIADFKDHPYYALERHLKRNEIIVSTRECGKVAAGRDSQGRPGMKKMESIYRRKDVKIVKSADSWYRLGRDVKLGEQPVKTVPAKRRPGDDDEEDMGDAGDERAGTNLYTEDQTELYVAPSVVDGRIPRNSFGNLDVFVPSMVPPGGVHIRDELSIHAARILGIDYAAALTGFKFQGRLGTPILTGVVVAQEYQEAMDAVIEGFHDEVARAEDEARMLAAMKMWRRFLIGLRIKERVDSYAEEGEDDSIGEIERVKRAKKGKAGSGGGFMPAEDDDEDDEEHGGGFIPDDDDDDDDESDEYIDDGGGGFIPE